MSKDRNDWIAQRVSPHFYYGWVVIAVVFVANLGAFSLNPVFGLFITPLENEFGWDRGTISRSLTFGTMLGAVLAPILGFLIDRFGTRRLMVWFGVAGAGGYVLLSRVEQVWQFNLLIGIVIALTVTGVGQMMGSINVNRWFVRRRGRAMGIVMMGASSGAVLFVPLCTLLILSVGWRNTYLILAGTTFLLISLPAWAVLVNLPEQLGLEGHRELSPLGSSAEEPPEKEKVWELRQIARTRAFWLMLAGIMAGSFSVQGYFIHAVPHMEARGFSRLLASSVWSAFFLTGAVAKFFWGFAIERIGVRWGLVTLFAAEAAGMYLLMTAQSPRALFFYAVFNGLGHGPYLQLLAMVWAEYFGRRAISRIYGMVQPAIVVAGSLGPWFAGWIFDVRGGYEDFFLVGIGMSLLAAGLFLLAPPPHGGRGRGIRAAQGTGPMKP